MKSINILDEEDEHILDRTLALNTRGTPGVVRFTVTPETKTVIGERKDGTTFSLDYGEFERLFASHDLALPDANRLSKYVSATLRYVAGVYIDYKNKRAGRRCLMYDECHDVVVQENEDGTRRVLTLFDFVRLFTPCATF